MLRSTPRLFAVICLTLYTVNIWAAELRHNYDLKNVLWKLSFSAQRGRIVGDVTNTLTLQADTTTVDLSCAELEVSKVTVNEENARFTNRDGVLTVTLPSKGRAGQTLNVRVLYSGEPVTGMYFVPAERAFPAHTGMLYTQGEGEDNHYWLPMYDKPDDKATTECFVTVPGTWTAISNGKLMDVKPVGANKVFHWKMDQPYSTYLISLVAGEYVKGGDSWHGIPVDFYVPPGLEAEGKASFGVTSKMIDLYSKLTGVDYPYAKFAQEVVSDFMFGGMENVTCVTQTIRTLHAAGTEPVNDSEYLVAHELAHHWFGDLITCRTWEHMWLNEGFATTLPTFWNRATRGQDAFDLDRYNNLEGAIDTIGSRGRKDVAGTVGSVPTVTMGSPYPGGSARIMLLFHMLGEDEFWKGINAFLEKYKFQPATTEDFFTAMSKSSGRNLAGFEKQWFHTAATPSLTVSLSDNEIVVKQLAPYYNLDLPVWVLGKISEPSKAPIWVKSSIHVAGPESRITIASFGAQVDSSGDTDFGAPVLLVDPEAWIPMELKYEIKYTSAGISTLYRSAPSASERARIIASFFDSLPVADRIELFKREASIGLRQMILTHIGVGGEPFLTQLAQSKPRTQGNLSPQVNQRLLLVNGAILALGKVSRTDSAAEALEGLAANNSNETIREHATQVLLKWATTPELATTTWKLKAFDDGFRKMALEWFGEHDPDKARTLALGVLDHPDSEPLRITAIQVLGKVKEKPGERAVYEALIRVAQETSIGARREAINALAQLGNKDAIVALQPMLTHAPNGIKGAAAAAIAALSK